MADIKSEVSAYYSRLIREQTRQVDLDSFRQRGVTKVNVINAKKINELIEKAVGGVISRMDVASARAIEDDKSKVILESVAEFKRLFKEQQEAQAQAKPSEDDADRVTGEVVQALESHMRDLRSMHVSAQAKMAQELHQARSEAAEANRRLAETLEGLSVALSELANRKAPSPPPPPPPPPPPMTAAELRSAVAPIADSVKQSMAPIPEAISRAVAPIPEAVNRAVAPIADSVKQAVAPLSESMTILRKTMLVVRQDIAKLSGAVAGRPPSIDPSQLTEAISKAVSTAQQDLLSRLERQGVMRSAGVDEGSADEAVASAVVRSAFRELDTGKTESHMGDLAKSREVKGDAGALDRLKKLRGNK